jgi:hypothetical protein
VSRHCPTCRCYVTTPTATLIEWAKKGFKAEGENWFCQPKCHSCNECPRAPHYKRYVQERAK